MSIANSYAYLFSCSLFISTQQYLLAWTGVNTGAYLLGDWGMERKGRKWRGDGVVSYIWTCMGWDGMMTRTHNEMSCIGRRERKGSNSLLLARLGERERGGTGGYFLPIHLWNGFVGRRAGMRAGV
jgi:hypothetical protein